MADKKSLFNEQVEEVLATFDLRAHHAVESLSWTWANLDRVPTRAELLAEVWRLLPSSMAPRVCTAAAGFAQVTRTMEPSASSSSSARAGAIRARRRLTVESP